jgi:hypothetical protein
VVVYDPQRHLAHSLNRAALVVWKHCSGNNSVTELRRLVAGELGVEVDESAIWLALRRLASAHLLVGTPDDFKAVSRRQVLRTAGRIGIVAAVTPLISSALVPLAAAAASRPQTLPACGHGEGEGDDKGSGKDKASTGSLGSGKDKKAKPCSLLDESCVCADTRSGARACVNRSASLKKKTCTNDSDCRTGYVCTTDKRCVAICLVPTCTC